jgi:hypothetical protein
MAADVFWRIVPSKPFTVPMVGNFYPSPNRDYIISDDVYNMQLDDGTLVSANCASATQTSTPS